MPLAMSGTEEITFNKVLKHNEIHLVFLAQT